MEKLFHLALNLPLISVGGFVGLLLFLYISLGSLVAIATKRADLADIAWGPGFMLVAWASFFLGQPTLEGFIVNLFVSIWAVRLALHLYIRNRNRDEDFRYKSLKLKWGEHVNFKLFTEVFLLQGSILYIVALPILWIHTHPEGLDKQILFIAFPSWLVGFVIETIADLELLFFKKDPSNKGKLLTVGLWAYVRHPNYLGELIQWWAIWFITLSLPFGWALIISPALLTFLIVHISGVKPLEEKFQTQPQFKSYLETTPSLIPPSMVNGILYGVAWFILVCYGTKNPVLLSTTIGLGCYGAQLYLFSKFDRASLRLCIPLSMIALMLGFLQELMFIHTGTLTYANYQSFPPLWILVLYPLFSLTLNSSLTFLNKSLPFTFFLGGLGGVLSYLTGERLGKVHLFLPKAYVLLFLSWALFLSVLIFINRKLRHHCFNR